jgi:hypothetical protein
MRLSALVTTAVCATLAMAIPAVANPLLAAPVIDAAANAASTFFDMGFAPGSFTGKSAVSGDYARNMALQTTTIGRIAPADAKTLPAGATATPLDGVSIVTCPVEPSGNCVIVATVTVQVGGKAGNNRISLCATIDGDRIFTPGDCIFAGNAPNGHFAALTLPFTQYDVKPGNHRLQSYIKADHGAQLAYTYVEYRVFK